MFRGRKPSASARPVTLYTRPGCHLCHEVQRELARFVDDGSVVLDVVDLSGNAELEARFGEVIPVLESEGRVFAKGRFRVDEAMARLQRREVR